MPIQAIQFIRSLPGRSRPQLVYCDDESLYVVKVPVHPGESRRCANEYLSTKLAQLALLPVVDCAVVLISQYLSKSGRSLRWPETEQGHLQAEWSGSRYAGSTQERPVFDLLPTRYLADAINGNVFAGMFAFDKWCASGEGRRAVFARHSVDSSYRTTFVNLRGTFSGSKWSYADSSCSPAFSCKEVYQGVSGWASFEPFLTRLIETQPDQIWNFATEIPEAWYNGETSALEELVDQLVFRRTKISELVVTARRSDPSLFPGWLSTSYRSPLPVHRARVRIGSPGALFG